ncbi:MAG TPA: hypothetical protein VLM42_18280, partial [Bryobacteraceae bacterium]|nr:hypothetical protein [Bryobacteraceae bacterium]
APHAVCLITLLLFHFTGLPALAQNPASLQIIIVEGEGAINNVKQRVNREPIVQVEDENHKPVAGAAIIFFLPNDGPGGTFANGSSTLTTTTNAQGQAVARGIRFNNQAGSMQIRVTASFAGQTASAIINQTNVLGVAASGAAVGGMSLATKLLIIGAVVGAGVAAGVVIANHGGGGSTPTAPTTITITPGTVTVGGPQ